MTFLYKGASQFYSDQGKGQPLILLHGFLENSSMWEPFISRLITDYRVICPDLPGHGQSESFGSIHTMPNMADVIKKLIDILQLYDVTIIGHSMGGYVGCAFAKAYTENLKALCLLNSTPYEDPKERKDLRLRANITVTTQFEQLVRMSFIHLFDPSSTVQHKKSIEKVLNEALLTPVSGYTAANEGMRLRPDYTYLWENTSFRKGFILGKNDWIIDATVHQEHFYKQSDYFNILDTGHMSHITDQKGTLNAIIEFMVMTKT